MAFVSQAIDSLLGGISQLAASRRLSSQLESQINAISSQVRGLGKRPPTDFAATLTESPAAYTDAFIHNIDRDADARFRAIFIDDDLKVFDETGTEATVLFPNGKGYLNATAPNASIRAVTIGNSTYILNRNIAVAQATDTAAAAVNEALVVVSDSDFETTFRVFVDGTEYSYQTPLGDAPEAREAIDITFIAQQIHGDMNTQGLNATFTITRYGNVLHLKRINGAAFTIEVEDGLGDAMVAIMGKVQKFSDLPTKAPNGFVVEVIGDETTDFDNYHLKFNDSGTPEQGGVWEETVKPGELIKIDRTTFLHELFWDAGGEILGNLEADTLPDPVIGNDSAAEVTDGFSAAQNAGSPETGIVLDAVDAVAYSNLEDADGTETTYRVNFWVDVLDITPADVVTVTIAVNDGPASGSFTDKASRTYVQADGYFLDYLEFTATLDANYDIRVTLTYNDGTNSAPEIRLYGEADTVPGVAYTPLGHVGKTVDFDADQLYPDGVTTTITVNGTPKNYLCPSDKTGTEVAVALQPLIDAISNITCTVDSAGVLLIEHTTTTPVVLESTDVDDQKLVIFTEDIGFGSDTLAGLTITNVTDSSTGVINGNGSRWILTNSALTGGTDNTFQLGDICSVASASEVFQFKEVAWDNRTTGDLTTNPFPSFIDRKCHEVFYHKGRLGVTMGSNVILTQAGKITNWFRSTVKQLLDGDVIDVAASGSKQPVKIHGAIEIDKELFLWSDLGQHLLSSGQDVLGPATVGMPFVSGYENTDAVRPLLLGDRIMFCQVNAGNTEVFEYTNNDENKKVGTNVTEHCKFYMPGTPISWAGSASNGLVAVLTDDDQSKLFVYKYRVEGGRLQQTAWSTWQFGVNDTILSVDIIDDTLGLVVKRDEGIFLDTMPINEGYLDANISTIRHLDRRMVAADVTELYTPATQVDNMTDTNGVHFDTHVADTGETYYESAAPYFTIDTNRAKAGATSQQRMACQKSGGAQFHATDEVWAEITGPTSGHASNGGIGFWFMASAPANPPVNSQDHYMLFVEFVTSGFANIDMSRFESPGDSQLDTDVVAAMTWANGATKRIGVTINSVNSYTVWEEPAGGGTRTTLGTWSPTPDPGVYEFLDSAAHTYMGLYSYITQFFSPGVYIDTLTHYQGDGLDETLWTLPVDFPAADGTLQVVNKSTGEVYTSTRPADNQIKVEGEGDLTTLVYLGWKYTQTVQLSRIYVRDFRTGAPLLGGQLRLGAIEFDYIDTQDMTITVNTQRDGSTPLSYVIDNASPLDGQLRVPISTGADKALITITNDTPNSCWIQKAVWEGTYTTRSRRI
jgi:hypothetical protein